jgi:hypothetical protein
VQEIHISGGSWSQPSREYSSDRIRRDTHDDFVPDDVFALLPLSLKKCPNVEAVILERLGGTMTQEAEQIRFREDFRTLGRLISGCSAAIPVMEHPSSQEISGHSLQSTMAETADNISHPDVQEIREHSLQSTMAETAAYSSPLFLYQRELMQLLSSTLAPTEIIKTLEADFGSGPLSNYVSSLEPHMIEVGQVLVKKWSRA